MKKNRPHYDTLGVKPDASQDDIKKEFRAKAKECHPDHHPGDKEKEAAFKELSIAYGVLGDPDSRRQYDETGEAPPINDILTEAYGMIVDVFQKVKEIQGDNIFHIDVFAEMKEFVASAQTEFEQNIAKLERQIKRNNKLMKKISYKSGDQSFLHIALVDENKQNDAQIAGMKRGIEVMKKGLEVLDDYKFDVEKRKENVSDRRRWGFGVDPSFDPYSYFKSGMFRTENMR